MRAPATALFLATLCAVGAARAQAKILHTFAGDTRKDLFGFSVGSGDVDADGYRDLIVGIPFDSLQAATGHVHVYSGKDGRHLRTFKGIAPGGEFGAGVAGAGDVNRDGHDDVIVGAPAEGIGGAARIYCGKSGRVLAVFRGRPTPFAGFGRAVAAAGDVDLDGHPDVIVGARSDRFGGTNAGSARVLSGRDGSTLHEFFGSASDQMGWSVAGAGDLNGDRHADLIVGLPTLGSGTGAVRLYCGRTGMVIRTHFGDEVASRFGDAVARCGDLDGDRVDDVIVGARWHAFSKTGMVRVFSGRDGTVLHTFLGGVEDNLGTSVGAADVDGDGIDDVLAGAPRADLRRGQVRIFSGLDGSPLYTWRASGKDVFSLGISVASAGDLDGDGRDEVIAGAPFIDHPTLTVTGKAQVLSLPATDAMAQRSRMGTGR